MIVIGVDPGTWPPAALKAYIAGIIDGEGCISVKRRMPSSANRMQAPKYSVGLSVEMTDAEPVNTVARFCGLEHLVRVRQRQLPHKPIFVFGIEHERAANLIREIAPYLIGKREQAAIALELHELRASSATRRNKLMTTRIFQAGKAVGHSYRIYGLDDAFVAQCDALYWRLRKRFLMPRAEVSTT